MSKVLWNCTDEVLKGTHEGIETIFQPGDKIKVEDRKANHILKHLEARGLTVLEYGDTPDTEAEKKAAALSRQKEFELRQVGNYNLENAKRKRMGLIWTDPTPLVKHFAVKWGVKLEETWDMGDTERQELAAARKRAMESERKSNQLESQVQELSSQLSELIKIVQQDKLISGIDKRTRSGKEMVEKIEKGEFAVDADELQALNIVDKDKVKAMKK